MGKTSLEKQILIRRREIKELKNKKNKKNTRKSKGNKNSKVNKKNKGTLEYYLKNLTEKIKENTYHQKKSNEIFGILIKSINKRKLITN
jgi:hypothetical protein